MDQEEKRIVKILRSLANPRRLQIILLLKKHRSLNVAAVAGKLDLSFRSTSKHLLNLESAGLIERKHQSREVFYLLSSEFKKLIVDTFARMSE